MKTESGRCYGLLTLVLFIVSIALGCESTSGPSPCAVDAGALKMDVSGSPWRMTFHDGDGV